MIMDRLMEAMAVKDNAAILNLDTRLDCIPDSFLASFDPSNLMGASTALLAYNKAVIRALQDVIACVKIQPAFYYALGMPGWMTMSETMRTARDAGLMVIFDGKTVVDEKTATLCRDTYWGETVLGLRSFPVLPSDFITMPSTNLSGIERMAKECRSYDGGIFAHVETIGSDFAQDQLLSLGRDLEGVYGYSPVGIQVDAMTAETALAFRNRYPKTFTMLNRDLEEGDQIIRNLRDKDGYGAAYATDRFLSAWKKWNTDDFATAAREEAYRIREEISGT